MAPTRGAPSDAWSIQLDVEPYAKLKVVDAGDAPVVPARLDARAARDPREGVRVAGAGPIPIVLGGDHSITYPAPPPWSRARLRGRSASCTSTRTPTPATTLWGSLVAHGTPMRRLIEEGWVAGPNFVQVGLRGYWPEKETFDWMREQGMRWHTMVEIEERGAEAVIADAIAEALDGPDCIYLSVDIDVVDPGHGARAPARPSRAGCSPRELLRAVRQIVGQVDLVGHGRRRGLARPTTRRGHGDARAPLS